jgi:D-tyrosyl-tRNA(Tyr) deacylase
MLLLIGVGVRDVTSAEGLTTPAAQIEKMLDKVADKIAGLRIFSDDTGKMNLNITQAGGSILAVSQFTLYADTSRGRRPGFQDAAPPVVAEEIYLRLVAKLRAHKIDVLTGQFGADMAVELCNNGPVTIVLEESPNP